MSKKSPPTVTQVGAVKLVMGSGDQSFVGVGGASAVGYDRARAFLKEQLYGDRHKRVPGNVKNNEVWFQCLTTL